MMRRTILMVATVALTVLVASGVALAVTKIGGPGPDTLRGTNRADNLLGRGGNDVLLGLGGSDNLLGEEGKDWVLGGNEVNPQGGDKNLLGGPGNDGFREFSRDVLSGGSGNDVIDAWHKPAAVQDVVTCGSGFDRVISDRADLVAPDCEKVVVVHGSLEDSFQQYDRFIESIPQSFWEGLPRY